MNSSLQTGWPNDAFTTETPFGLLMWETYATTRNKEVLGVWTIRLERQDAPRCLNAHETRMLLLRRTNEARGRQVNWQSDT